MPLKVQLSRKIVTRSQTKAKKPENQSEGEICVFPNSLAMEAPQKEVFEKLLTGFVQIVKGEINQGINA